MKHSRPFKAKIPVQRQGLKFYLYAVASIDVSPSKRPHLSVKYHAPTSLNVKTSVCNYYLGY